jgi:hypothetical protein
MQFISIFYFTKRKKKEKVGLDHDNGDNPDK